MPPTQPERRSNSRRGSLGVMPTRADLARSERLRARRRCRCHLPRPYVRVSRRCLKSGVADRLAALDRQLVAGVGVVSRLRAILNGERTPR